MIFALFRCLLTDLLRTRRLAVLVCWLCLTGCSAIKPLYNNADTAAYFLLDGYIDVQPEQKVRIKNELQALHNWHRTTQLPAYAALLQSWQPLASSSLTPAQVCSQWTRIQSLRHPITAYLEPQVVWLATNVNDAQRAYLKRSYDKGNAKWRKDWAPAQREAVVEKISTNTQERLEFLYGTLNAVQISHVQQAAAQSPFDTALALRHRLAVQQEVMRVLDEVKTQGLDAAGVKSRLNNALVRMQAPEGGAFEPYFARLRAHNCDLLSKVHNSADPAQRAYLNNTLKDYAGYFQSLSQQ